MAHCPPEKLEDLADLLDKIRALESVKEKSRGVFYFKSLPFLHFHIDLKTEARWADVRDGKTWGAKLPLEIGAGARAKIEFFKEVTRRHGRLLHPAK